MTRVNEERETQRREQERLNERVAKEKHRTDKDDFSKLVSQKQEKTAKANRDQQAQQGKQLGQQAQAAKARLAARQGIQAQSFQEKLNTQSEKHLGNKQIQNQSRGKEADKTRHSATERTTSDTKERVGKESDKLAPVSRDDRQGGRGDKGESGGKEMGQQSNLAGSPQGMAQANTTQSSSATQQAQGAHIPPELIQQIVERVMVGINKEGLSEFHIEFKENILAGSSLQLTAKDGKISARFRTTDVNVKRLLRASEGPLARAFARKGMSLEHFEVEGP